MKKLVSACLCCFISIQAAAQSERDYLCRIERVSAAGFDGQDGASKYLQSYVGKDFSVNRRNGVMSGGLKNSYITRPDVIDRGSKDNSFKAVTTLRTEQGLGPGSNANLLVIEEFRAGPTKPFVYLENGAVYFGTCVYN